MNMYLFCSSLFLDSKISMRLDETMEIMSYRDVLIVLHCHTKSKTM